MIVLCASIENIFCEKSFTKLLNRLPICYHKEVLDYNNLKDRHSHLIGRLLLLTGLKEAGISDEIVIKKTPYGKPYLSDDIHFSISHSGKYVVCAFSTFGNIGIDIQEIIDIDCAKFNKILTTEEILHLETSPNTLLEFFNIWTRKESIIKADGKGLSISLNRINTLNKILHFNDNNWVLNGIFIDNGYVCCVASIKNESVFVRNIKF